MILILCPNFERRDQRYQQKYQLLVQRHIKWALDLKQSPSRPDRTAGRRGTQPQEIEAHIAVAAPKELAKTVCGIVTAQGAWPRSAARRDWPSTSGCSCSFAAMIWRPTIAMGDCGGVGRGHWLRLSVGPQTFSCDSFPEAHRQAEGLHHRAFSSNDRI